MSIDCFRGEMVKDTELDELGSQIHLIAVVLSTCVAIFVFFQLINGRIMNWFEWVVFIFFVLYGPWQIFQDIPIIEQYWR